MSLFESQSPTPASPPVSPAPVQPVAVPPKQHVTRWNVLQLVGMLGLAVLVIVVANNSEDPDIKNAAEALSTEISKEIQEQVSTEVTEAVQEGPKARPIAEAVPPAPVEPDSTPEVAESMRGGEEPAPDLSDLPPYPKEVGTTNFDPSATWTSYRSPTLQHDQGALGMAMAAAAEEAEDPGITVNVIGPSTIKTGEMLKLKGEVTGASWIGWYLPGISEDWYVACHSEAGTDLAFVSPDVNRYLIALLAGNEKGYKIHEFPVTVTARTAPPTGPPTGPPTEPPVTPTPFSKLRDNVKSLALSKVEPYAGRKDAFQRMTLAYAGTVAAINNDPAMTHEQAKKYVGDLVKRLIGVDLPKISVIGADLQAELDQVEKAGSLTTMTDRAKAYEAIAQGFDDAANAAG